MHFRRLLRPFFFSIFLLKFTLIIKCQDISIIDETTNSTTQNSELLTVYNFTPDPVFASGMLLPPSCANNILPANGSIVDTSPVVFRWTAVPNANRYILYLSTNNPPAVTDSVIDVSDTSVSFTGLIGNKIYYWYVVPTNSDGSAVGCNNNYSTFSTGPGPVNDFCNSPTTLSITNGYCGSPALGSLAFADTTEGLGVPSCQTVGMRTDVWYEVFIPATGNVTIQTSAVDPGVTDLVLEAFTGSCGNLISIGCNDDGNTAPTLPSALHAKLGLTGRPAGERILIRVTPFALADVGEFAICAFDTTSSVSPPVAAGIPGNCIDALPIDIGKPYRYGWVTLTDANGHIVAQVYPNGNSLGVTTASFFLNDDSVRSNGSGYYLDRNLTLSFQNQPTSNVTVRMYFKDVELQALSAVAGGALRTELNATRTTQTCASSAIAATCTGVYVGQYMSGSYLADHYADYRANRIGTLYLHKGTSVITGPNIWTGRINDLWENSGNWSCGRVPDINTDVVVNAGTVRINSAVVCRRLLAGPGANITIGAGFSLRVVQ